MPDQTSPSATWMEPPERQGQHRDDRFNAVIAAIVAGGLGFISSLYPISNQPRPLDLFPLTPAMPAFLPKLANLRDFPNLYEFPDFDRDVRGVPTGELPGMAELLEFVNHEFTDFVEHGLTGIPTDELPALDTLREFMKHTLAGLSDGGSGGGSGRGSA